MKIALTFLGLLMPLWAQEPPAIIQIPEGSPLAQALARFAGSDPLKSGTLLSIEITPPPGEVASDLAPIASVQTPTLALLNYRGKKGAPSTVAQAATRSGETPDIRIVVLSSTTDALTHLSRPRLWWYQSSASEGGELEFILTKLNSTGDSEVFRRLIPPMPQGYNVIDLSHPAVNPKKIALEPGHFYQWTINHREGSKASPAYSKLHYLPDKLTETHFTAATTKTSDSLSPELLNHLSTSGNWHETLDLVATYAKLNPEEKSAADNVNRILQQADLLKTIFNKP